MFEEGGAFLKKSPQLFFSFTLSYPSWSPIGICGEEGRKAKKETQGTIF
jgi:hypothetical protein